MKITFSVIALILLLVCLSACQQKQKVPETKIEDVTITKAVAVEAPVRNENPTEELEKKYRVAKVLNTLPQPDKHKLTSAFASALDYFRSEPGVYSPLSYLNMHQFRSFEETDRARQDARDYHIRVMIAYGLLQTGNNPIGSSVQKPAINSIFKNIKDLGFAYQQGLPSVKIAFKLIPVNDRRNYMSIFQHTKKYLDEFDINREEKYLAALKEGDSHGCFEKKWQKEHFRLPEWIKYYDSHPSSYITCESLFTSVGPDGQESPYRKIEAFVYRRAKAGWPVDRMKFYVTRLIYDLTPLV